MNPILIKPRTDTTSQVVLLGRVWGQTSASDYHTWQVEELFPAVLASYRKLASAYDLVLLEGAGSPAEINLRDHDIVNLRMAKAADARCVLFLERPEDLDRADVLILTGTKQTIDDLDWLTRQGFAPKLRQHSAQTYLAIGICGGFQMLGAHLEDPCGVENNGVPLER